MGACRDNFKEAKVSLHTSGKWRMGFTIEALVKNPFHWRKTEHGKFGTSRRPSSPTSQSRFGCSS